MSLVAFCSAGESCVTSRAPSWIIGRKELEGKGREWLYHLWWNSDARYALVRVCTVPGMC